MKILVIGSGGREHALIWKLAQSPRADKLYCAPGNGGISQLAECVPVSAMDTEGIVKFAAEKQVDLVVVAPDDPLAAGMVDTLEESGLRAFGPRKCAALIEGSKVFSKALMKKYGIPSAGYEVFEDSEHAIEYLRHQEYPLVVKADGLALGKGVIIASGFDQAQEAVHNIMDRKVFGSAGDRLIIEEFLNGSEVTVLAFTDGKTIIPMVSSQDHKRALDNDKGLNTGGMGTFSPSRIYTPEIAEYCMKNIYVPTMDAMNKEDRKFKGVLYFGLMLTESGPKVLEYNARFGDPEAQVVLPRLENDLIEIFDAIIDEKLDNINITWKDNAAVCVVMASGGYPQKYSTGYEISGIENAELNPGVMVFHAGTKCSDGKYFTNGGRVLGVTATADTLENAIGEAYRGVAEINFRDMHFRRDIGIK